MAKLTEKNPGFFERNQIQFLWTMNPAIFLMTLISIFALLVSAIALNLDPNLLAAESVWLKPFKFGMSLTLYGASLLLVSAYLKMSTALKRASILACAGAAVELAALFLHAFRSANYSSLNSPLDTALWLLIKLAIMPVASASIVMLVLLMRQKDLPPVLGSSLRWGLALAIAGFVPGLIMLLPDSIQHIFSAHKSLTPVSMHSAVHTLPFPGWHTQSGDLRAAHFLGLHALQIMPLIAIVIDRLAFLPILRRKILISISGYSYFLLLLLLTWEALRGEPVFAPTWQTQDLYLLIALLTIVSCTLAVLPIKYAQLFAEVLKRRTHVSA